MIPDFKYHPDPLNTGAFTKGDASVCDCCGKQTVIWYENPFYSAEDIECLCPECIFNGTAAEKFEGEFQDSASVDEVSDPAKLEELTKRTPGYCGWQQEYWLAHCDDYCAFIGYVGMDELEQMGLSDKLDDIYRKDVAMFDIDDVRDNMVNQGSMQGYLFRCLHCGKYSLYVDCD